MKKILSLLLILSFVLSACTVIDPMTKAQSYLQKGDFDNAISLLEVELKKDPESVPIKSLLAQIYSDYGLSICQDNSLLPKDKYPLAKTKFQTALTYNPYLTEAEEMVKMIETIEAEFKKSFEVKSAKDLDKIEDDVARAKAEENLKEQSQTN